MTFADQLFNRDISERSAVFPYKVEHFPHGVLITAVIVSDSSGAFLFPKNRERFRNYFLRRPKNDRNVTRR
jgi:hypothetical protein